MSYLNRVFLMGNLTRDPELKFTKQGTACTKFSLAVNRSYKGPNGELTKQVDFFTIVVWGKSGESCGKYLTKGQGVHVEGRIQTRSFETQDHQKRTVTEIVANSVQFLNERGKTLSSPPDEAGCSLLAEPAIEAELVGKNKNLPRKTRGTSTVLMSKNPN